MLLSCKRCCSFVSDWVARKQTRAPADEALVKRTSLLWAEEWQQQASGRPKEGPVLLHTQQVETGDLVKQDEDKEEDERLYRLAFGADDDT